MLNPVHIDGNSVVWIVQQGPIGEYVASESGILEYDGETLSVMHADGSRRDIDEEERDKLLPVSASNRIPACDKDTMSMKNFSSD